MKLSILSFFLLSFLLLEAQISFQDVSDAYGLNTKNGVACGILDINADGADDIVLLDRNDRLKILINTGHDKFQEIYLDHIDLEAVWSVAAGDIDGDGWIDLLLGEFDQKPKIVFGGADMYSSEPYTFDINAFLPQGSNLADIDGDGLLDVFICDDNKKSHVWKNLGNRSFEYNTEWFDMVTIPQSDNSGNYAALFTDIDWDGDVDMYISKCRIGVDEWEDPRRINMLFENDGNNYQEVADQFNLKVADQSWATDFGDLDGDGDQDAVIINHEDHSMLMMNDGNNNFVDISLEAGFRVDGLGIQVELADFDNDMDLDIFIAGTENYLYINQGNMKFENVDLFIDRMTSFAVGDINRDGSLDFLAVDHQLYNSASDDDRLFLNGGNQNNYVQVLLHAEAPNTSAIGARLELFIAGNKLLREIRSGEAYGIQNSLTVHYGLGIAEQIDSLVIYWPNGEIETLQELEINTQHYIQQNKCVSQNRKIYDDILFLCDGDSIELSAGGGDQYIWNTGATSQSIQVSQAGVYNVKITDGNCVFLSDPILVEVQPDQTPQIEIIQGDKVVCEGDSVVLITDSDLELIWQDGSEESMLIQTSSGNVYVTASGFCEDFTSDTSYIEFKARATAPIIENDTILITESATLISADENTRWYTSPLSDEPIHIGPSFLTGPLLEDSLFYADVDLIHNSTSYNIGKFEHDGGTEYHFNGFDGSLIFDVYQDLILKSVKLRTDFAGEREFILLNFMNDTLDRLLIDLEIGEQRVNLNWDIAPGESYSIKTNTEVSNEVFGHDSPLLWRSGMNFINYPYELEDYLIIQESNVGAEGYYYFYDWEVSLPEINCPSERVAAKAVVINNTSTSSINTGTFKIYPNPVSDFFHMNYDPVIKANLCIMDALGNKLYNQKLSETGMMKISISALPAGAYYLVLEEGSKPIILDKLVILPK